MGFESPDFHDKNASKEKLDKLINDKILAAVYGVVSG